MSTDNEGLNRGQDLPERERGGVFGGESRRGRSAMKLMRIGSGIKGFRDNIVLDNMERKHGNRRSGRFAG